MARLRGGFCGEFSIAAKVFPCLASYQRFVLDWKSLLSLRCPSCSGEEDARLAHEESPEKGFNSR